MTAKSDVYGFGVVLLEMLIGRKAMDKSRPAREQNLVDWARPVLPHSRKLLKIVDSKLDGQYSNKVLNVVAELTHRCLNPNPKRRPTMDEVVETLVSIQDLPEASNVLLQSGGNSVTLFEVSKVDNNTGNDSPIKKEAASEVEEQDRKQKRHGNGRGKSEPSSVDLYVLTPSVESDNKHEDVDPKSSCRIVEHS